MACGGPNLASVQAAEPSEGTSWRWRVPWHAEQKAGDDTPFVAFSSHQAVAILEIEVFCTCIGVAEL